MTIAAAKHYLSGKGAVRVHGGGFAGTVQAFVPVEDAGQTLRPTWKRSSAQAAAMC